MANHTLFVIIVSLSFAAFIATSHYYMSGALWGCIALPLRFAATAALFFFGSGLFLSVEGRGANALMPVRLAGAFLLGAGSCYGLYWARQILHRRNT
jgi:hypothetical protein